MPEVMRVREALQVVGGLSSPSKMPCRSWGIPASACRTGGTLAAVEGTVCYDCYCRKGRYRHRPVRLAYERRLLLAEHPEWVEAMALLVQRQAVRNSEPFFRWFDSGDLQSAEMLGRIAQVARETPGVAHGVPTREYALVCEFRETDWIPDNLTVRLSALLVDGEPPDLEGLPTSTVHRREAPVGHACPAYGEGPAECGDCRACWDRGVVNVSYSWH